MTRLPKPPLRPTRSEQLRQESVRQAILRQHRTSTLKRSNVGKTVGSFVPKLAQKAFEKYGFSTVALLTDWSAIVGQELADTTRPEKLKWPRLVQIAEDVAAGCEGRPGATLVLRVEPARALDVEYGAAQIVDRINSYFGYRAVADLRILQMPLAAGQRGEVHFGAGARTSAVGGGPGPVEGACGAEDLLAAVSDEQLRNSLQRLQAGLRRS